MDDDPKNADQEKEEPPKQSQGARSTRPQADPMLATDPPSKSIESAKWYRAIFDGSESLLIPGLSPGDLLIHFRSSMLGGDPKLLDYWIMDGGEKFAITNREDELPRGFELHPSEAINSFAHTMKQKFEGGWRPGEIMEAPNLWRVREGDRVAVMVERPSVEGGYHFSIYDFPECALVYWMQGDGEWPDMQRMIDHGPQQFVESRLGWAQLAVARVKSMGLPRTMGVDWRLG